MAREFAPNGGRLAPPGGWAKHEAEVEAIARRRARRTPARPCLDNLRPGRIHLVAKAPRCIAIARLTGKPCRMAAMVGAARCHKHGGYLEAPTHPANAKRWADGFFATRAAKVAARTAFYQFNSATRATVQQAYTPNAAERGVRRNRWHHLLAGAQALEADTTGKAFRRWIASLTPIKVDK